MNSESPEKGSISIMALESGVKYETLDEAPDVLLLIELLGIRPTDLAKLSQRFGIDIEDLQDVQDLDERSRLQIEDNYTIILLRVPVDLRAKDRQYSTIPTAVFTNGRDIIIIQKEDIPTRKSKVRQKVHLSTTAADIVYRWWEIIIHAFESTLDIIETTINETEDVIMREMYPSQLEWFFQLSRDAIFIEAALKSNTRVLQKLEQTHVLGKLMLDVDRLEELEVDLQRQTELSAIYRELIDNAMNAYDSMAGHNLNRAIRTLTSISLLVSVPTLIASVYGMNVGLPFQENPMAFAVVMGVSFATSLILLFILRRMNLV